jgi:hypothetical protein
MQSWHPRVRSALVEEYMSDCLHCDINDLVQEYIEKSGPQTVDVTEIAAKMAESLADLILSTVPADQTKLLAQTIAYLGDAVLQRSEAGSTDTTH